MVRLICRPEELSVTYTPLAPAGIDSRVFTGMFLVLDGLARRQLGSGRSEDKEPSLASLRPAVVPLPLC